MKINSAYPDLLNEICEQFDLKKQTCDAINDYIQKLFYWNKKFNLVGHKNECDFLLKSGIDCLLVGQYFLKNNFFDAKKALDFGSGAGLPGVILKILEKNEKSLKLKLHLIESKSKKSFFLRQVNLEMGLGLKIHQLRLENFQKNNFNLIVSRATYSSVQKSIDMFKNFLSENGQIFLMKSNPITEKLKVREIENIKLSYKNEFNRYLVRILP